MAATKVLFRIAKISDDQLVTKWIDFATESNAKTISFKMYSEIVCHNIPVQNYENHEDFPKLKRFIDIGSNLLSVSLNILPHTIDHERQNTFDQVTINLPSDQKQKNIIQTANLIEVFHKYFQPIDLNGSLMELFDADLKRYYEQRESGLIRLEQLSEKLITNNEKYRLEVDEEKNSYKDKLEKEYKAKLEKLDERKAQLDAKEEEMELADSKSARRKMRQDILNKLNVENIPSIKEHTTWPIHAIFMVVTLTFFALSVVVIGDDEFKLLDITHSFKLALASIGFVGSLTLYYRWLDSWIRRGFDEKLRDRQLAIDVDRSSWVVEMLSELKEETNHIPNEVLTALTRNLFTGRENTKAVSHPGEDALAYLLASSKDIEIDFPGGKVKTDGKSAQKASQQVNAG